MGHKKNCMIDRNLILIEGGAYLDIKKALRQWIDLYSNSIDSDCRFELYKNGRAKHIIKVDNKIDNERFNFLVNYLKYPVGIDYNINVVGYTTITDPNLFLKENLNSQVLIFNYELDKDSDNVYALTSDSEVFKIDFGGKTKKVDIIKKFIEPNIDLNSLQNPDILFVEKNIKNPSGIDVDFINKRFKIITIVITSLFILSYIFINNTRTFLSINYAIGFGMIFWFFWDYKMLQINRFYLRLILFSTLILIYGHIIDLEFNNYGDKLIKVGTVLPLFSLLVQWMCRFIFKTIMKREPIVDRPAPSLADGVYMFIFLMTCIIVPIVIINNYAP